MLKDMLLTKALMGSSGGGGGGESNVSVITLVDGTDAEWDAPSQAFRMSESATEVVDAAFSSGKVVILKFVSEDYGDSLNYVGSLDTVETSPRMIASGEVYSCLTAIIDDGAKARNFCSNDFALNG